MRVSFELYHYVLSRARQVHQYMFCVCQYVDINTLRAFYLEIIGAILHVNLFQSNHTRVYIHPLVSNPTGTVASMSANISVECSVHISQELPDVGIIVDDRNHF